MPLIRARQKAMKDLPEWFLCCEAQRKYLMKRGQIIIEVSREIDIAGSNCSFCSQVDLGIKWRRVLKRIDCKEFIVSIPVDCFDFDEGPGEG